MLNLYSLLRFRIGDLSDPGSGIRDLFDPGGIQDGKIRIRDNHPGSRLQDMYGIRILEGGMMKKISYFGIDSELLDYQLPFRSHVYTTAQQGIKTVQTSAMRAGWEMSRSFQSRVRTTALETIKTVQTSAMRAGWEMSRSFQSRVRTTALEWIITLPTSAMRAGWEMSRSFQSRVRTTALMFRTTNCSDIFFKLAA